jgi:hypothetical protein
VGRSKSSSISDAYTYRVAIANTRLIACENGQVNFRWKDYRAGNKSKMMTLDANEFIRRFLLHVLPKGFRRIRHFGFLANTCRTHQARGHPQDPRHPRGPCRRQTRDYRERCATLTGHRIDVGSVCGGTMILIGLLYIPPRPASDPWNTS